MVRKQKNNQHVRGNTTTDVLDAFSRELRERPVLFSILWVGAFSLLLSLSITLGVMPTIDTTDDQEVTASTVEENSEGETAEIDGTPVRVIIERIGVDTAVVNPSSASIDVLDAALLKGVVRYPGSGNLTDTSNMFLFGHSTGFRVVQNEAFKAFNDLDELVENDLIRVRSTSHEYVYRVTSVRLVNADEAFVEVSNREKKLTLSTCNTFGEKQERFVVEAAFVGSYPLEGETNGSID